MKKSTLGFFIILLIGQVTVLNGKKTIVTNFTSPCDGFGAQFRRIIAAVFYAEMHKRRFVYTPFQAMSHNYLNDPDFLSKKEIFINFINHFPIIKDRDKRLYNIDARLEHIQFMNEHINEFSYSSALIKIKKVFRENKTIDNYFNNNNLNIALHIRRHNSSDDRIEGTNTPDDFYIAIINSLRIKYISQNPIFHIYSQGELKHFACYISDDVIFHVNESIEDSFLGMVLADVLVTGTSTFGYTAGLLSNGTIYYTPFWGSPLPHWISVENLAKVDLPKWEIIWL